MIDVNHQTLIQVRPIYRETMEKSERIAVAMKTKDWQIIQPQMGKIMEHHKS